MRATGIEVSSYKELMEVGRLVEEMRGRGEGCKWRDQIREYGDFL